MFIGSFVFSYSMLLVFSSFGNYAPLSLNLAGTAWCVAGLSLLATVVEALSPEDWDNVTIPVAVTIVGHFVLPLMFL